MVTTSASTSRPGSLILRRLVLAAVVAALVVLGVPGRPALAAGGPKVVVVVGPVGPANAHYISDANSIVAAARRYTSNVIELVTPNATWNRVRAAAQGASVFVYLGHGNGWPSPYPPFQTATQDGLGLDPNTGGNGSAHVYYGEDYIRSNIRFAPNAVVLLYHLCYASGNTEPGMPVGTLSDSRAAGRQLRRRVHRRGRTRRARRGAPGQGRHELHPPAVHDQPARWTRSSAAAVTYHGHVLGPYPSQRTPGLSYEVDPDTALRRASTARWSATCH